MSGGHADGVLARMIRRSREPLSSLEPVIQPRFATRGGGFAGPGDNPAPDALPPGEPLLDARLPGAADTDISDLPETSGAAGNDDRFPHRTYQPMISAAPQGSGSPPASAGSPPGGARTPGVPGGAPAVHEFATAGGFRPASGTFPAGAAARDSFVPGDRPAPLVPDPLYGLAPAISGWPGPSQVAGNDYRPRQAGDRSVTALAEEAMTGVSARGPVVTITIGHIEVRAAPAPQRPAQPEAAPRPKPAFRPQTTLAEFLGDGAGRPRGSGRR
jgi:hypothetical protein